MRLSRTILVALSCLAIVGSTTACGNDEEKQTVLKEVGKRGFGDPALAPDVTAKRTVYVYATYKGCRLRLEVLDGRIGYPGAGDDISPTLLDADPLFAPCRTATSGAQPGM